LIRNILIAITAIALIGLGIDLFIKNVVARKADWGDAPSSYGLAIHYQPDKGPYFGAKRGDDDSDGFKNAKPFASDDNENGMSDEDALSLNPSDTSLHSKGVPVFAPEIHVDDQVYSLTIPIKDAEVGDPVRGWIDFNGDEKFDKDEKASAEYKEGKLVTLTWQIPSNIHTSLSYLRIRTCNKVYKEDIEFADGAATTGEVEDYVVRIIKAVVPSTEIKENLDLSRFMGASSSDALNAVSKINIGDKVIHINIAGNTPDFINITNFQEASIIGFRVGHETKQSITKKNPVVIIIKSDVPLENLRFKLLDVDGGERVKIEGFEKGSPVLFTINNLTDNFYQQFNSKENEVFGSIGTDAGEANYMKSSLDMGINVSFPNLVDSIKLTYSDESTGANGSITLGDINIRKYSMPRINIQNFTIEEVDENVDLFWKIEKNSNVGAYSIERSYDGKSYEIIGNSGRDGSQQNTYTYIDKTILPIIQDCFYRIKVVEKDNHVSYSEVLRLKRKNSSGLSAIKATGSFFTSSVELMLLVDMPGEIKVNMYDYQGNKVFSKLFKDIKKDDLISLDGLTKLPPNSYYIQVTNSGKRSLVQVEKNERTTSASTIVLR
jgi:hypothetical protein